MSRRGENIYKRKDNRWEGRYIKEYGADGKARLGYVYGKSYKEVRNKLQHIKVAPPKGLEETGKKLSEYCDEWLTLSRNRVKESTYVKYQKVVEKHIKPGLGDYMPDRINALVIEEFSNTLLVGKNLSTKTVRDILTVLRTVLNYVYKQDNETERQIDIIYPKDDRKEMRILSLEEQEHFTNYLVKNMDEVKFGILLALFSGLRIGELCALKWKDIDLEHKTISVNNTMQRIANISDKTTGKTKILVSSAKSEHSKRVIPLTERCEALCQEMTHTNPEAYVLTGKEKRFMEPRTLQYRLQKYTRDCNLDGVHFHTLRHTFATRCVEVDFELKSLSKILGHANSKITLDRYVHSSLELKRANMDKLKKLGF